MTGPRDWDKELAEIDKIIASGKASPPAASAPAGPVRDAVPRQSVPASQPGGAVVTRGHHVAGVWVRALLGVAVAAALPFWPYGKSCGTMLYLYLLATLAVTVVGVWTMRHAWNHRRGVAHVAGLFVFLAGLGFAAFEIFQRTSLAAAHLTWTCP